MRALLLVCLLAFAGCDTTSPTLRSVDGRWGVDAATPACGLSGTLDLIGTEADFSGDADLVLVRAEAAESRSGSVVGNDSIISIPGGVTLTVNGVGMGYFWGTWTCDGQAGQWSVYRYAGQE